MNVKIEPSWHEHLQQEFEQPYFAQLTDFVRQEYTTQTCYPPGSLIFNAFNLCPFDKVKVVIIGQDPYHEPRQAQGLSFSVADGVPFPPSLQNIFKEIQNDLGKPIPTSGDLTRWAKQGVLLLNATLTVRAIRLHRTSATDGRRSPMPPYVPSQPVASTSYSFCGADMRAPRRNSSTARATSSSNRFTPHRSQPTAADGSATTTSHAATPISNRTE